MRQDGRLPLQPLVFNFEFCNLKILLTNFLFHLCDDLQLFLNGLFEVSDLLGLLFDPIPLSFATPK